MSRIPLFRPLSFALTACLVALPASAQWTSQSHVNTVVSTDSQASETPKIIHGANDGTFVAWEGGSKVYLQFIDAAGNRQGSDRLVSSSAYEPEIVSDGAGGAIVAWRHSSGTLHAQRFDETLTPLWATAADLVTFGVNNDIAMISDGAGGAVVSWSHRAGNGMPTDVHAQHVDAAGAVQWNATTGFAVVTQASSVQGHSALAIGNGPGEAFIVWEDDRFTSKDIFGRYIDPAGGNSWNVEQIIAGGAAPQHSPQIITDDVGGALVAWVDALGGTSGLNINRISPAGAPLWGPFGIPLDQSGVNSNGGFDNSFSLDSDGASGAVVAWVSGDGIRYNRVDSLGAPEWPLPLGQQLAFDAGGTSRLNHPALTGDGAGGAVVTWADYDIQATTFGDIHAQYVEPVTGPVWQAGGVTVADAPGRQLIQAVVSDGECPAKVVWDDNRPNAEGVYIQRIQCSGLLGLTGNGQNGIGLGYSTTGVTEVNQIANIGIAMVEAIGNMDRLGPTLIEMVFDANVIEVLGVRATRLVSGLNYEVDANKGRIQISFDDAEVIRGRGLFKLITRGVAPGASTISFTKADAGEEVFITPSSTIIKVVEAR